MFLTRPNTSGPQVLRLNSQVEEQKLPDESVRRRAPASACSASTRLPQLAAVDFLLLVDLARDKENEVCRAPWFVGRAIQPSRADSRIMGLIADCRKFRVGGA